MNYKTIFITPIFLFTVTVSALQARHKLSAWIGQVPQKIAWTIHSFDKVCGFPYSFRNRIILHGPPGNGKTSLAQEIANLTGSKFIRLDAPSLVNRYQGSGPEAILSAFNEAANVIRAYECNVVIFIDEIDAIAANTEYENRGEAKNTLQQLWIQLDAYKNEQKMLIICATNDLNHLHKTFLDRFGNNVIKIDNPDLDKRKKLLAYYSALSDISLDTKTIATIAKKTAGLSARAIEDMVSDMYMYTYMEEVSSIPDQKIAQIVNKARDRFADNKSDDQQWQKKLERASLYITMVSGFLTCIVHTDYVRRIFLEYRMRS